jgi:hypothetical protein
VARECAVILSCHSRSLVAAFGTANYFEIAAQLPSLSLVLNRSALVSEIFAMRDVKPLLTLA